MSRGRAWIEALSATAPRAAGVPSVLVADASVGAEPASYVTVVPDPRGRFRRARGGEVGLEEGWTLARTVRELVDADEGGARRVIVAVVDVPSQAYGRLEELCGIHLACAAAADAYATARLRGHPVIALVVGHAMSGGFLAHGYQANRILALRDPGVTIHAMGKTSAARVTQRTVAELDALAARNVPLAYDIETFATLGILHRLIDGIADADAPTAEDAARVRDEIAAAADDARSHPPDLSSRLSSPAARKLRAASIEVRRRLAAEWASP
jgi:malonate decarboxylase gamma subunit